jgi:hypothetical protein
MIQTGKFKSINVNADDCSCRCGQTETCVFVLLDKPKKSVACFGKVTDQKIGFIVNNPIMIIMGILWVYRSPSRSV